MFEPGDVVRHIETGEEMVVQYSWRQWIRCKCKAGCKWVAIATVSFVMVAAYQ